MAGDHSPRDSMSARQVVTREVDCRWLFNHLFVGILVVDARPAEHFASNTLVNAVSVPPMTQVTAMEQVEALLAPQERELFSYAKRSLRVVVIVGESTSENAAWCRTLQELLVREEAVVCVSMLREGFAVFRARYPFYTVNGHKSAIVSATTSNHRVTYPNEILDDFLYLGNLWQAENRQIMEDLGITHIVNATLDLGNVFEADGVKYHEVKIPDQPKADSMSFFDSTFEFIHSARVQAHPDADPTLRQQRPRVFVHCTQGISRSATLVIMYLMRAEQWTLVMAFNHTHSSRPIVFPNDGFLQTLMQEERRLRNGVCSVADEDLDELLRGRLVPTETIVSAATPAPTAVDPVPSSSPPVLVVAPDQATRSYLEVREDCDGCRRAKCSIM